MTVYAITDTKKGRTGIAPTYLQTTPSTVYEYIIHCWTFQLCGPGGCVPASIFIIADKLLYSSTCQNKLTSLKCSERFFANQILILIDITSIRHKQKTLCLEYVTYA